MSVNLQRRHLTKSQRAVIALDLEAMIAKEQPKGGRPEKHEEKIPHVKREPQSREEL